MVLDKPASTTPKLLKGFLEESESRLELVLLPPYSPNLNKIEKLWGWLKDSVINNVFFRSVDEIRNAVQKFIVWVNAVPQTVIDRLCLWAIIYRLIYNKKLWHFYQVPPLVSCNALIFIHN